MFGSLIDRLDEKNGWCFVVMGGPHRNQAITPIAVFLHNAVYILTECRVQLTSVMCVCAPIGPLAEIVCGAASALFN